ncbi:endolytic transglycosylase MltG [Microbacterium sp. AZCO]|uniref:endolytic transglycosylase MltG n=1 Tax=Microbacterium sp. AZCO TaxID=3142976 RepID=UPI0031F471FA
MPRSSSPYDDPFADLFGKLPDPRVRGGEIPGPRRTPAPEPGPGDTYDYAARPATPRLTPFSVEEPIGGAIPASVAMTAHDQAAPAGSHGGVASTDPVPVPASADPAPAQASSEAARVEASIDSAAVQGSTGSGPATTGAAATGAPLSRRAAREARAAQAATGPTDVGAAQAATGPTDVGASNGVAPTAALAIADVDAAAPASQTPAAATSVPPAAQGAEDSGVDASPPATAVFPVASFEDLLTPQATAQASSAKGESAPAAGASREAAPSASLEDLFMGTASSDQIGRVPPPPNKRRRRVGGWIALGIVLLILGGIAAGGLYVWNTYEDKIREFMGWEEPKDYEAGQATGEALVTISSGDTGSTISTALYDAGVTKTSDAFYDMLVKTGQNPTFYPGVYKLQKKMTSDAALTALQDPANKMENSALLQEGLTIDQMLPIIAEGTGIPLPDLQAAVQDPSAYGVQADSLEGWLFPAMYTFDPGTTAQQAIQQMVDRTVQSLDAAGVPVEDRQRVLTIASIIQREARFEDDFYKVSRVIENRLDPNNDQTFGLLQMDSTAQYGYGEMHDGTVSSSQAALDDDNPWNTYKHPGLPKGPIASPGDKAIDAAMHPADGPWLYFVTVNPDTGETVFTTNVQDHEKAVKQWQEWCAANPGKC